MQLNWVFSFKVSGCQLGLRSPQELVRKESASALIVVVRTQFFASCCQFLSAMLVRHGLQFIALGASAV